MLRGTTYVCRQCLHTRCPVTADTRSGLLGEVQPDCSQGTFTAPGSRRLTPAAFSLRLRRGTTRLVIAFSRFRLLKL